jgi:nitrous oxidase accessory protein NosD
LEADDITWDGFTIRGISKAQNSPGMYTSPKFSGYLIRDTIFLDNGNGIHLGASGDHPTLVCRNRFTANNEFATAGYGIFSDKGAKQVLITSNLFERHNAAAIFLGDEGDEPRQRDVLIEHNKSVDDMSFATIFNSTRVRLTSNWIQGRVNDPPFTDKAASAIFIGARNVDVVVQKNKVTSTTGNGIDITDTNGQSDPGTPPRNVIVRKNKVRHAEMSGIEVSATGDRQYQVLHNRSLDNDSFGIHFAPGTKRGTVTGNTALDNKIDCKDESTGLQKNIWTGNVGRTSVLPGLCTAPTLDENPGYDVKGHDKKKHHKHHKKKVKKHKKQHRPDPCVCTLPWRF